MYDTSELRKPIDGIPLTVDGLKGEFRNLSAARMAAGLHQREHPASLVIRQNGIAVDIKRA